MYRNIKDLQALVGCSVKPEVASSSLVGPARRVIPFTPRL